MPEGNLLLAQWYYVKIKTILNVLKELENKTMKQVNILEAIGAKPFERGSRFAFKWTRAIAQANATGWTDSWVHIQY